MSSRIYIYRIYFPESDKCYIGQTNELKSRMRGHLRSDYPVGNALRKYDDWKVSVLHACKSRDVANTLEIEEIRNFNSVAPNGYNLTSGGEVGKICSYTTKVKISKARIGIALSEETKTRMSAAKVGNKNANGNQSFKGHKHTEESKEKNRKAHLGRKRSAKTETKRLLTLYKNQVDKLEKELKVI